VSATPLYSPTWFWFGLVSPLCDTYTEDSDWFVSFVGTGVSLSVIHQIGSIFAGRMTGGSTRDVSEDGGSITNQKDTASRPDARRPSPTITTTLSIRIGTDNPVLHLQKYKPSVRFLRLFAFGRLLFGHRFAGRKTISAF